MSNYYSTTVAFVLFQLKKHSAQEIRTINKGELSNINFIADVINVINVSNCLRINTVLKSETLHFLQRNSISSFCLTSMASQQALLLLTVWYLDLNISRESAGSLGGTHSRGICNFQEPFSPSLDADSKNQKPNSKYTNSTRKRYVACPAKKNSKDTMDQECQAFNIRLTIPNLRVFKKIKKYLVQNIFKLLSPSLCLIWANSQTVGPNKKLNFNPIKFC